MTSKEHNLKASINSRIEGIAKVSAAFKSDLAWVVRELLVYVPDSGDIGSVNRLISVLNKTDANMVIDFFRAFLPWKYEPGKYDGMWFTTKSQNKPRVSAMYTNITTWLKDEKNNIWDWKKERRERPELPVAKLREQQVNRIENVLHRALDEKTSDGKENKARLNPELVLNAVLNSGITVEEMFQFVNKAAAIRKAEAEKLKQLEAEQAKIAGKPAKQDNTPAKKKAA